MIDHLSDGKFSQFERLFRYLYSLFRPRLALLAASIVVPLTFLLVSSAIDSEAGKWTVQVDTPPVLGFPSLYRATDNGGIKLPFLETVSNSTGGFSTYFNLPGLEKDDLRILIPGDISGSRLTPVSVQFISANGLVTVNLGSVLVPTYSESRFDLESKTNRDAYLKLPHLSPILLTLPDVSGYLKILYWSLWLACCMSGLLFFISIKTGSGALWRYSFLQSIWGRRLKELISKNPLLVLLILNTGLFVGVALCFTQRYPVSDDPIMAMIASGMIGVNPSEHLIYINIIVGFLIKCLAVLTPSIPWYDIFISGILVFSSSIIGLNLIRKLGIYRGLIAYAFCFIFFIFQSFYQLQFTTTAATLSIAGLSLALSSENFKIFNFEFAISLILLLLGSLIRPEATVLVIIISTPVLTFLAFRKRQFQLPIFLLVGLVGVILLKDIDSAYYEGSSDWKFYREYNLKRGALHGTSRLREFKSNDAIYSEIKWNENDFYMFSQDWIYQDLKVFSQENLNYLGQKLSRAGFSSGWYFFFLASYDHFGSFYIVFACFSYFWITGRLATSLLLFISGTLIGVLYYLAWASHLPDHVYIAAVLETFVLAIFLSSFQGFFRKSHFWSAFFFSIGLFIASFQFISAAKVSERDEHRTVELNKALKKIAFLDDKIFQVSITSLRYEDIPPFENYNCLRRFHFIDGLWTYPSPDSLSTYHKYGIQNPISDLVLDKDFFLLIPTFAWDRGTQVQTFLRDHYQLESRFEVVKDPSGKACCYPNFTVLKFNPPAAP